MPLARYPYRTDKDVANTANPNLIAETVNNWRLNRNFGRWVFHDLAPHQLDLMLYYFGEPAASTTATA
jgi:predicted dehydrogenase